MTETQTKATHTPGPWECETLVGHVFHGDRLVANCRGHDDSSKRSACQRENEANARAIAALPELLEALSWIVVDLDFAAPETFVDRCHRWADRARAAISKATGGEG